MYILDTTWAKTSEVHIKSDLIMWEDADHFGLCVEAYPCLEKLWGKLDTSNDFWLLYCCAEISATLSRVFHIH